MSGNRILKESLELVQQSVMQRKKEKVKDDRKDFELNSWKRWIFIGWHC